jgi:hypothetical protein
MRKLLISSTVGALVFFAAPALANHVDRDTPNCITLSEMNDAVVRTDDNPGWLRTTVWDHTGPEPAFVFRPDGDTWYDVKDGYFYRQSCSGNYQFTNYYERVRNIFTGEYQLRLDVKCVADSNGVGTQCVGTRLN